MTSIRSGIWCAAFVRRQNDKGNICVVSRKGDDIAGQVWIEVDHLNGTSSLYTRASSALYDEDTIDWLFQARFEYQPYEMIKDRIDTEISFDPDFWLLTLESRGNDHGLELLKI